MEAQGKNAGKGKGTVGKGKAQDESCYGRAGAKCCQVDQPCEGKLAEASSVNAKKPIVFLIDGHNAS